MKRFYILLLFNCFGIAYLNAQERISNDLEIDKLIHNFGDVAIDEGPVSCEFKVKNTGKNPAVIYNVVTTCGCTKVDWTKEPIKPGESGKISVTFSNDEGPYPFDKNVTLYISGNQKPTILKLRGVSHETLSPIEELYPIHLGALGLKERKNNLGSFVQGSKKVETLIIANVSDKEAAIAFKSLSKHLSLTVNPTIIPAKSTAELKIEISSDKHLWGRNEYVAIPVVDGQEYDNISIYAFTRENFDNMTEAQISQASMPRMYNSTFAFGKTKAGSEITATFKLTNEGKSCFCVYKVDIDACRYSHSDIPVAEPGEDITFRVHLDTTDEPIGRYFKTVTLTTNSPNRPTINLFISGIIE